MTCVFTDTPTTTVRTELVEVRVPGMCFDKLSTNGLWGAL